MSEIVSHLQEQANKGMNPATAVVDPPAVAGRTRVFKLPVENLGVSAPGAHVRFTYRSELTRSTIFVSGMLDKIRRPVPVDGPPQPVLLKVDRLWYAVPAGTLVSIETGEIR